MRVTPGAGGVVEGLVGEEVLIGVGEGGAVAVDVVVVVVVVGVVESKGIDLDVGGGICAVFGELVEGCIEIVLHRLPLPLALIVFEKVRLAVVVLEEA